jgi:rSAM/selenodomain-associated transferase 2
MSGLARPLVSLIVPVRRDAAALAALLAQVPADPRVELVVSVGGEFDAALAAVRASRPDAAWVDGPPGRGPQMNRGAGRAQGDWLWFVHADSRLPEGWQAAFVSLDGEPEVVGGSFAFRLDSEAWQARWLERAVALRVRLFDLPYGDQGIFVRRRVFHRMGGYAPWPLMEDVDFARRLTRQGRVRHLSLGLVTSARRWEREGWLRRSAANVATLAAYAAGVSPERLARRYYR